MDLGVGERGRMMIPKFRVWDKENKIMWNIERWNIEDEYFNLIEPNKSVIDLNAKRTWRKQSDVILMQSTGLFDKNGKEIFEGDIVVNQYGNVGYIAYLQQEAGFVVVMKKSDYRLGHRNTGESYEVTTNHEIIGNIFENSGLLERVV